MRIEDVAVSADSAANELTARVLDAGERASSEEDLRIAVQGAHAKMGRLTLDTVANHTRPALEPLHRVQVKSRDRVRDLAEVYTHKRQVDAMLDLVPGLFPSAEEARPVEGLRM